MGLFLTMLVRHAKVISEAADELFLFAQRLMQAEEEGMIFPGATHSETGVSAHWFRQSRMSVGTRG